MLGIRYMSAIASQLPYTKLPEHFRSTTQTAFFEGNNFQINEASRLVQTHLFEDKLAQMLAEYQDANGAVQGKILDEISRGVNVIRNEKSRHEEDQRSA
jgi:hypothetical protein